MAQTHSLPVGADRRLGEIPNKQKMENGTLKNNVAFFGGFCNVFLAFRNFEKNGKTYRRVPEVLDCWFESGSMPYAQEHYPFENKERFEANFPADFICEGLDQTRGWFYTLAVLGSALFDTPAFNNCVQLFRLQC